MKIRSIQFKNINSLKGVHQIDFNSDAFLQSKLFAITGPTGAGKSTILDVITLSLFNKIPRHTKGKHSITAAELEKNGSILTRGTQEASSEVEYEVKGKIYISKWMIRTNRNGKLVGPKMEVALKENKEIIEGNSNPKVIEFNESNIGLSYDQFIKSILLSQGAFDKFLKADKKDRGLLLEKITGVDIFRKIGSASFEKASLEEQKLEQLKIQLGGIQLLSSEELEQLELFEKNLDSDLHKINENILNVQRHINIKNQVLDLRKRIESTKDKIIANAQQAAEFKKKEDRLLLHHKLINHRSDIIQFRELSKHLRDESKKLTDLKDGVSNQQEELEKKQTAKEQFDNDIKKLLAEQEELAPIIEHVKFIDKNIDKEEIVVQNAKELFNQVEHKKQQLEQSHKIKRKRLIDHQERHRKLVAKLDENPMLTRLKSEAQLLENKIKQVLSTDEQVHILQVEWEKIAYTLDIGEISPHRLDELKKLQSERNVSFKKIRESITWKSVDEIDEAIEQLNQELIAVERYNTIKEQWNSLSIRSESNVREIAEAKNQISPLKETLKTLNKRKEHGLLLVQELEAKFKRLSMEEQFVELRKNLKEGEPCPLCASTHHPLNFEKIDSEVFQKLEEAKKELASIEKEWDRIQKEFAQLEQTIILKEEWLDKTKAEEENLSQQLRSFDLGEIAVQEHKQKKESLLKERSELLACNDWERASLTLESIINQLQQIKKVIDELEVIAQPYQKYFDGYHIKEWSSRIRELLSAFEKASNDLNELDLMISQDKGAIDQIEFEIREEELRLKTTRAQLVTAHESLQNIISERKALFGEQDPEQKEKEIRDKISAEKEQLQSLHSSITAITTGVQIKVKQIDQINKELAEDRKTHETYADKVQLIMQAENLNDLDDLDNALLSDEELHLLEEEREAIKTAAIQLDQELKSCEEQLSEIRDFDSEVSIDTLNIEFGKLKTDQNKLNQEKGRVLERTRTDRENRKQAEDVVVKVEAQEKELSRWKVLKEYIGDKTGDKFSIFAQELTLAHLIELANRRLSQLDDRYVLKKYDPSLKEEDIIVLDTYQGNTKRSVKTLSGGETFMISLAMALSLSDLASQNVKIDSLFIDEGFGTLDEEALDKALSTLEQLQVKSNKMIGIISHVPALKERISTQVKVHKNSNGFSTLEVV